MKKNVFTVLLILGILLLSGFSEGLATQQITIVFDGKKLDCESLSHVPLNLSDVVLRDIAFVSDTAHFFGSS